MIPSDKGDLVPAYVWNNSILELNRFAHAFLDEFGGWAQETDIKSRDQILDLLSNAADIMTARYDHAIRSYLNNKHLQEGKA